MTLLGAACSGDGTGVEIDGPSRWTVHLAALRVSEGGVGFAMHPADSPIVVQVRADGGLKICPADPTGQDTDRYPGASFGSAWVGGCLKLARRPVRLPAVKGHVGFRVLPTGDDAVLATDLWLTWDCEDDYFEADLSARDDAPPPSPDC